MERETEIEKREKLKGTNTAGKRGRGDEERKKEEKAYE